MREEIGIQNQDRATTDISSTSSSESPSRSRNRKPKNKTKKKMSVTPRSADYEGLELEGGMGAVGSRHYRRLGWTWKRIVVGVVVVIGMVWVVGRHRPTSDFAPPAPSLTFSTDPSPSTTTHCTAPHNRTTSPLIQYALIIDAGSTGSRIHIYKFNNCNPTPALEWEEFHQTQPGLSAYAGAPLAGAQSIDVLMAHATRVVPRALWACAPVALKATAGLRLLPGAAAAQILRAVEERLRGRWGAVLAPGEAVGVMDGRDEGVYAWITANYLMGRLGGAGETYGVLDLGGASTQIAFEPGEGTVAREGEHRYELGMAGRTHVLYQHSYLGYGLMRAREHVHALVHFMARVRANGDSPPQTVGNPCLASGTERIVEIGEKNVTMVGDDIGSFDACTRIMDLIIAKDAICTHKPCSFNGVYQPPIHHSFPTGPILLLSYFYDRLSPLLPPPNTPLPLTLTLTTLATLARTVCAGRTAWATAWPARPAVLADLAGRPEYCLDLTFMHALLSRGYGFAHEREVRVAKKVGGTELGWCLGAALEVVAGDLTCAPTPAVVD